MAQPIIYLTVEDLFVVVMCIGAMILGAVWWRQRGNPGGGDAAPVRRAQQAGVRVVALFDDYAQLAGRIAAIHAVIEQQGPFMPPELKAQLTAEVAAAYARLKKIHDWANEEISRLLRERSASGEDSLLRFIERTLHER